MSMSKAATAAERGLPPLVNDNVVVFMGMGEPLNNFEAVERARAVRLLVHTEDFALSRRNVCVSTVGPSPAAAQASAAAAEAAAAEAAAAEAAAAAAAAEKAAAAAVAAAAEAVAASAEATVTLSPAFTMAELDVMRDDVFAQDIPLLDEMRFWTREAIDEYFRTGGEVRPVGVPVPPPVAS